MRKCPSSRPEADLLRLQTLEARVHEGRSLPNTHSLSGRKKSSGKCSTILTHRNPVNWIFQITGIFCCSEALGKHEESQRQLEFSGTMYATLPEKDSVVLWLPNLAENQAVSGFNRYSLIESTKSESLEF